MSRSKFKTELGFGDIVIVTILAILMAAAVLTAAAAIAGTVFFAVWQLVVAPLAGLPEVSYWQALVAGGALAFFLGILRGGK